MTKNHPRHYRYLSLVLLLGLALPACDPASDEARDDHNSHDTAHSDGPPCASAGGEDGAPGACLPPEDHAESDSGHEDDVVRLTPKALADNGIGTAIAGPKTLATITRLYGRVAYDGDHLAHIKPRYAGVATGVERRLGEQVSKGDLLATIESTESLTRYDIRSLAAGTVVEKNISVGGYVEESETIFQIADLRTVWIDFDVFPADYTRLEISQPVSISVGENGSSATTTLSYLAPLSDMHTQARLARAVLPNPKRTWLPGRLVTGRVETGQREVAVAVPPSALQRREGASVVFLRAGEAFRSVEVELGARDEHAVEIISGLQAGSEVAAENSFLLKAELGKAEAHHDH